MIFLVCKNCGAFLSDDLKDCPVCGALIDESADNSQAEPKEVSANTTGAFISPDSNDDADKPQKNNKKFVIITVVLSVLLVIAIAVCILLSVDGVSGKVKGFFSDVFSNSSSKENNNPNEVVAEFNGAQLTNVKLNYYYYDLYETFYSMYGDQLEAIISTVLNEGETIEDFITEYAITEWTNTVVLTEMASKANFSLTPEAQAEIDSLAQTLAQSATAAGYANADAFVKSLYGDFATAASYLEHYQESTYAYMYKMDFFNEKYYDYLDDIAGLDTFNYSVRHILFQPADTKDDAAWTAAEKKANEIYQQWLDGEATEESFGELAKEHSSDGSAIYGGLYEDIPEGYMVEEFNDWCFAEGRKVGDHGIVKTEFGYHIMYFVAYVNPDAYNTANSDLSLWINTAKGNNQPTIYNEKITIKSVD